MSVGLRTKRKQMPSGITPSASSQLKKDASKLSPNCRTTVAYKLSHPNCRRPQTLIFMVLWPTPEGPCANCRMANRRQTVAKLSHMNSPIFLGCSRGSGGNSGCHLSPHSSSGNLIVLAATQVLVATGPLPWAEAALSLPPANVELPVSQLSDVPDVKEILCRRRELKAYHAPPLLK